MGSQGVGYHWASFSFTFFPFKAKSFTHSCEHICAGIRIRTFSHDERHVYHSQCPTGNSCSSSAFIKRLLLKCSSVYYPVDKLSCYCVSFRFCLVYFWHLSQSPWPSPTLLWVMCRHLRFLVIKVSIIIQENPHIRKEKLRGWHSFILLSFLHSLISRWVFRANCVHSPLEHAGYNSTAFKDQKNLSFNFSSNTSSLCMLLSCFPLCSLWKNYSPSTYKNGASWVAQW